MPRCKECGEPIRWAVTPAGKKIALDDSSDPAGTYLLQRQRDYTTGEMVLVAIPLTSSQRAVEESRGALLFLAHAASCAAVERPLRRADPDKVRQLIDSLNLPEPKTGARGSRRAR